jgi:photosystem II stability/assembly factor-like uncharacterized protein
MPRLYVGTNGLAVWTSTDLGRTLTRMGSGMGMYSGSQVWALAPNLAAPGELLAGTDTGLYRLDRAATRWSRIASPMDNIQITAIACSPHNPAVMICGTQPAALYRSEDAGRSWTKLDVPMKPFATIGFAGTIAAGVEEVKHWTRVTQILFDPKDAGAVWAGVEIDGAWRSTDGGKSFARTTEGLITEDIHGFGVLHDPKQRLFATTDSGLHESRDAGATWTFKSIDSKWQYVRSIAERPDQTGVVFMTNGDGPPGSAGRLWRSRDRGANWEDARLPGEVESSLYFLAVNAADPMLVFAAATLGQIYISTDGGESWVMLRRRLGEIRCLAWLPD